MKTRRSSSSLGPKERLGTSVDFEAGSASKRMADCVPTACDVDSRDRSIPRRTSASRHAST
eukprot:scaffold40574_cov27-Tisochrysis_lutea.AAC.16